MYTYIYSTLCIAKWNKNSHERWFSSSAIYCLKRQLKPIDVTKLCNLIWNNQTGSVPFRNDGSYHISKHYYCNNDFNITCWCIKKKCIDSITLPAPAILPTFSLLWVFSLKIPVASVTCYLKVQFQNNFLPHLLREAWNGKAAEPPWRYRNHQV